MLLKVAFCFTYMLLVIGVSITVVLLCNYRQLSKEFDKAIEKNKQKRIEFKKRYERLKNKRS